jgi:hypothetical protein
MIPAMLAPAAREMVLLIRIRFSFVVIIFQLP